MSLNQIYYFWALAAFILSDSFFLAWGNTEGDKSDNSVYINLVDFKLHIHHWMIGLVLLASTLTIENVFYTGQKNLVISFIKGLCLGMIFHGLTFYTDYFFIFKPK